MSGGLRAAALVAAVSGIVVLPAPGAEAARSARSLSAKPIPASSAWRRYVIKPGALVYPKRVRVIGVPAAVSNPDGLKAQGGGETTINATGAGVPRLVLDVGVNTGGRVEVGIAKTDGTRVRLGYSELRSFLTPSGDTCGCGPLGLSLGNDDEPEGRADLISSSGPVAFASPGIRGAQRYVSLQLEDAGTVSIDYVRVRPTHLRVGSRGYAGHFHSNDRVLNRVWYSSAYTFALDSFPDHRVASSRTVVADGAKRDRLIWAGDVQIENLLGQYSLRAAPRIMRRSLQAFSCLQYEDGQLRPATGVATTCPTNPPAAGTPFPPSVESPSIAAIRLPEYTASWIVGLHDYLMFTGDRGFARRMLPVVRRGLEYFRRNTKDGLFLTPSEGLTINWHPFDQATGYDSHTNATLYRALRAAADLERRVGSGRGAGRGYTGRAARIKRAMLARLWDSAAGAFVINPNDQRRNHTQDAQVEAVLAGVTSRSQSRRALRFIDRRLQRHYGVANGEFSDDPYMSNYISPFISSTELLARLRQRDINGALRLIRRTWGRMLVAGPGTVWEKMAFSGLPANYAPFQAPVDPFGSDGAGSVSLAHGWSGGPVPALSGYVLGIRPLSPGYRSWIVAPQPGNLRFAQGQARTPRGRLVSRWRRARRNHAFRLTVVAPRRTSGVVEVPLLYKRRRIWMDGRLVWNGRRGRHGAKAKPARGAVRFRRIRGRHTFAWRAPRASAAAATCAGMTWVGAWGAAPSDGQGQFSKQSLRMILTPLHGGRVARVRLSNRLGEGPLRLRSIYLGKQRKGPRLVSGSNRAVRFNGRSRVTVPGGRSALSDPVRIRFRAFQHLAVSAYVPGSVEHATMHNQAKQRSYMTASGAGNRTRRAGGTGFSRVITGVLSNAARPFVTEVQTRASRRAGVVVAVGDSITDGDQRKANLTELGIDEDARYPDFLARRLRSHRRRLSVINEGIGGNRILRDAFSPGAGPSLLRRLHVDVLARRNVTDVILMAGTNDLGFDPAVTADDVIRGLRRAVQRLNRLNVLVGTIPPRSDGLAPPNTNARRNAINHWIRTSGIGDGVVDFDRALRDPSNRSRLAPRYDAGDGLHPSSAGYRRMARTVRLSRLEGPRCGRRRPVARVRVQDAAPIP